MATAEPPRCRDAVMQDNDQNNATASSILEPALPRQNRTYGYKSAMNVNYGGLSGISKDNLKYGHIGGGSNAVRSASPRGQSDFGLYASEGTRLAVCMHILHAWRHDASTMKLLTLVDQGSSSLHQARADVPGY